MFLNVSRVYNLMYSNYVEGGIDFQSKMVLMKTNYIYIITSEITDKARQGMLFYNYYVYMNN